MNSVDGLFNYFAKILNKFADKIPAIPDLHLGEYAAKWSSFIKVINDANKFVPLDTITLCLGIVVGFIVVMLAIFVVKLIIDLLPF